jgi:DNA-binding SARP family transcriptional activator
MMESLKIVTRSAKVSGRALKLHLNLLGPPEARLGQKSLTFPTRKTAALLIYLALEGGEQPREHLAALLWPEANPERSHASLRNTLGHLQSALRRASGRTQTAYLSVTHTTLALNPEADILLDLHMVARAYAQARADRSSRTPPQGSASLPLLQAAADCSRGDFLAGFSLGDAPAFDDWAAVQREVWRRRLGLILDRLSEIQFAQGELASTAETASLWIALDALNEVAYRRKMRAHFAAGERGQALETYDACRTALAAELGVQPEPDTEALAGRIRAQYTDLSPAAPRPHLPDTPVTFLENLFAGRTAEHQALVECYERAAAGVPQIVTLHGEAGIGKTSLAEEFLAWAVDRGAQTLYGRTFESGSRVSYQPLIEAFRPLVERENALKDWLGEAWLAPLSQLLPELRERYPELSLVPLEAPADRRQLFESLVRLTLALSDRAPLVLFVDDVQWADGATLDLLQYAIRRWRESAAPILLLVSLRSELLQLNPLARRPGLSEWLTQVERELEPYHLRLETLSEQDTVQLMLAMLVPPAADFAQWVFNETRGQPFYLIETLKDLLERGALHPRQQADGKWAFEVDARHDLGRAVRVPSTVRAVIRSRLNRLSPNAFALLAAGAALEHQLTFERLCAIAHIAEDVGLPALDELVSAQLLLEAAQPGGASVYVFAHHMIWDVVYTEAGDARRRLFHRRALDILEAARSPAAVLAYHAVAAGLAEAGFRHSLAAGHEALRLSAAGEAVVHFEKARQLAQEAPLAGVDFEPHLRDLYVQLGRAYELNGRPEQAAAVYDQLSKLA